MGVSGRIDRFGEVVAQVYPFVHPVQVDRVEHGAAAFRTDLRVIEPFGLPFDQHVPDVEDHGRDVAGQAHEGMVSMRRGMATAGRRLGVKSTEKS